MQFRLLENGMDSLTFGLQFYYKYLKMKNKYSNRNPGYLKMGVISIHNAVELLSKKLLADVNELLIYKNLDSEILLEIIGSERTSSINEIESTPIEWSLISRDADVQTIDYNVCIKRLSIIFDLSNSSVNTLNQLSYLRNKLSHFGINKQVDFFEILIVINNTLKLIMDFFFEELATKNKYFDLPYGDVEDILEEAAFVVEGHWSTFYSDNFRKINKTMEDLQDNEEMINYLKNNDLKMKIITEDSKRGDVIITFKDNQGEHFMRIDNYHIPGSNLTLFVSFETGLIYFVIDHDAMLEGNNDLYIYKSFKHVNDLDEDLDSIIYDIEYWNTLKIKKKNKSKEQNECIKKEFNIPNIIFTIGQIINKGSKNRLKI